MLHALKKVGAEVIVFPQMQSQMPSKTSLKFPEQIRRPLRETRYVLPNKIEDTASTILIQNEWRKPINVQKSN